MHVVVSKSSLSRLYRGQQRVPGRERSLRRSSRPGKKLYNIKVFPKFESPQKIIRSKMTTLEFHCLEYTTI